MKKVLFVLLAVLFSFSSNAQTGLKKVYNKDINPLEQIDKAVVKAKSEGKFVFLWLVLRNIKVCRSSNGHILPLT